MSGTVLPELTDLDPVPFVYVLDYEEIHVGDRCLQYVRIGHTAVVLYDPFTYAMALGQIGVRSCFPESQTVETDPEDAAVLVQPLVECLQISWLHTLSLAYRIQVGNDRSGIG